MVDRRQQGQVLEVSLTSMEDNNFQIIFDGHCEND